MFTDKAGDLLRNKPAWEYSCEVNDMVGVVVVVVAVATVLTFSLVSDSRSLTDSLTLGVVGIVPLTFSDLTGISADSPTTR